MGGKNKQNRTKNNARPSSSARSAELLGNQTPTFFGLGAIKDGAVSMLPGVPAAAEEVDGNIDTNFQLALKKMVKKDATTKLKALQEFSELCQKAEVAEVKAILPFWPRLYSQLCGDTEHRVREAAHNSHKAVIAKVKKHLAPYLKEIIGPWFASQYDTYPPAASAAVAAFQEAFSPSKMSEAVAFCQEDILSYFHNNLTVQTPQTLSNPKTSSAEEMEDKYRRVVSSSLLGYASYLQKVTPGQLETGKEANSLILSSPKFWKLGQHKDPFVRHSFLTAVIALCEHAAPLLSTETPRLASAVFNRLSEDDPLVLPVVWDALLHCVTAVPECWNHTNVEKQVIPKLLQILRSGGKGYAATIFPKVLPLLSQLPTQNTRNQPAFLIQLFSSIRTGLLEPSVNRSQSESRVVASTFVESLQYMIMVNREDTALVELLVKDQLVAAIEAMQSNPAKSPQHTALPLACHTAKLLRSWYKNAPLYDSATSQFWVSLEQLFQTKLQASLTQDDIEAVFNSQTEFVTILHHPSKFMPKSNKERVKFSTSPDEITKETVVVTDVSVGSFDAALEVFAQKLATQYIERFKSTSNSHFLKALLNLGQSFESKVILEAAAGSCDLFELFISSLQKDIPQDIFIGLGLQLLPHLRDELQSKVLELLSKREELDVVLLCRGLLSCSTMSVKRWIREEVFSDMYLHLVRRFLVGETDVVTGDVLYKFLAPVPLVNPETCHRVVSQLTAVISSKEEPRDLSRVGLLLETCGKEACVSEEFQELVACLFCSASAPDGDAFVPLLRVALTKVKYFRVTEPSSWLTLASRVAQDLVSSPLDVSQVVLQVGLLVQAAYDVDLTESCEVEEIHDAIPLVKVFLETPSVYRRCAETLKKQALRSCEVSGVCSVQYFELKGRSNPSPHVAPDEDILATSCDDTAMLLGYRARHVAQFDKSDTDPAPVTRSLVSGYLQWLEIGVELVKLLLSAYPLSSRVEDMSIPGRYIVEGKDTTVETTTAKSDVETDVVPRRLSAEDWADLEAEAQVKAVFSRDEYPDQNLLLPLGNQVLDILESVAVLDLIQKFFPEMEYHPLISSECGGLKKEVEDMIVTGTPCEVEFLYQTCQALVAAEASWCALQPSISAIFCRRFLNSVTRLSSEDIVAAVLGIIAEPGLTENPDRVMKLTAIVRHHAHCLTLDHWNDVFIQMESALKILCSAENFGEKDESLLLQSAAVSSFFVVAQECFEKCLEREDEEKLLPELVRMWDDIVEKELWLQLFAIWRSLIPLWQPVVPEHASLEEQQGDQQRMVGSELVVVRRLCEAVVAGLRLRVPEDLDTVTALAEKCAQLLLSPQVALQITAFRILISLVPELVQADTVAFTSSVAETPQNEDKALFTRTRDCDWTVKLFSGVLGTAQTVVDALLSDLKAGDTCTVEPFTDAFTYAHGYLLLWCVIVEMCGEAHVALRFQYAAWLKQNGHLPALLKALFNFMPTYVVHGDSARDTAPLFESYGSLHLNEPACSEWVEHRACFVYRMCLQRLPAAVREWWSEEEHNVGILVARATSLHVSPLLISAELRAVQNESIAELENITVAVSPVAREVVGTYFIDEATMQIIISLPSNYPLGTIKVDFKAQNVIPRAWRISMFLVHRNGSLRDALALWKSDLDKKFEGVEECEICFSILHGPNFDIPKQSCKTCRKKFHSACLYKWFSTSNKSSCPHCRNQY